MRRAIGVDLGGTKVAAGVVDDKGKVLRRKIAPSAADDPAGLVEEIASLVRDLQPSRPLNVGVGAAGIVDFESGRYLYGPNLGIRELDVPARLGEELGVRVVVDNDANVAAWAEHRFGSGRGTRHFLLVTLGTGIGGGIVVDGKPYRGAHGGAAEIGHMLVDPNGPPCGCGQRGCWEQFASGKALERMAREELVFQSGSRLNELTAGDPMKLFGPMVTNAAREGDAFALDVVGRVARWIGWGLGSLVNILEPETIAISGGLARDWDLFAKDADSALRERFEAPGYREPPKVTRAELEEDAGIVGAAWLVLSIP